MNAGPKFDRGNRHKRLALACLCVTLLSGCQTQPVVLSPPMHARVVDGLTGKPLDHVRVTLLSLDAPMSATAYSDGSGFVDMPGLIGQENFASRYFTNTPRAPVHAIFELGGYQPYTIDSWNGYGFFKRYRDVHLYRD